MVLWRTAGNKTALKEDGDQVGGYRGTYASVSGDKAGKLAERDEEMWSYLRKLKF